MPLFFFGGAGGGRSQLVVELDHFVRGEEYLLRTSGNYRITYLEGHPRGSYMVLPWLSLEVATLEIILTHRGCHPYAYPPHKRFLVGWSSPFMRLAEHLMTLAFGASNVPGR